MQSDLISRDMLQKRIRREPEIIVSGLRYIRADAVSAKISMAPSVGAVEVVRCRECEHWQREWVCTRGNLGDHYCAMIDLVTSPDFYCKCGARMDAKEVDNAAD